jgi:hypothetical protein
MSKRGENEFFVKTLHVLGFLGCISASLLKLGSGLGLGTARQNRTQLTNSHAHFGPRAWVSNRYGKGGVSNLQISHIPYHLSLLILGSRLVQ